MGVTNGSRVGNKRYYAGRLGLFGRGVDFLLVLRNRGVQKQWLVFYFCGRILNLINSKRLGVAVALPVIVQAFNWLGLPHRVWVSAVTPEAKLHTLPTITLH